MKRHPQIQLGFLLLLLILPFLQHAQSWKVPIDSMQGRFGDIHLSKSNNNDYIIRSSEKIARVDIEGIVKEITDDPIPSARFQNRYMFDDNMYVIQHYNSFGSPTADTMDGHIINEQFEISDSFSIYSSAYLFEFVMYDRDTIHALNYYRSANEMRLETYSLSTGKLIKSVVLGTNRGTNPSRMKMTEDGRIICFNGYIDSEVWSFDRDLNLMWKVPNQLFGGLVRDVASGSNGELFLASYGSNFTDGEGYILANINKDGILLDSTFIQKYTNQDGYEFRIKNIAVQDSTIALSFSGVEFTSELFLVCLNKEFQIINTFNVKDTINRYGFSSNLISNHTGGYLIGYSEDADGDESTFESKAVIYSLDAQCNLVETPTIGGIVFYDKNKNGLKDDTEIGVSGIEMLLLPDSTTQLTDENGMYSFSTTQQESTTIELANLPAQWMTDSSAYTFTIDENTTNLQFDFPLQRVEQEPQVRLQLTSSRPKCDSEMPFWLGLQNIGNQSLTGKLRMELPNSVAPVEATEDLVWSFEDFGRRQFFFRKINLKISEEFLAGDTIRINVVFETATSYEFYLYERVVDCSTANNRRRVSPIYITNDNASHNTIQVYPNPVQSILHINGNIESDFELQLFNQLGQMVKRQSNTFSIDIDGLPNGAYFLKLISPIKNESQVFEVQISH
jgi:hypothetical protein